MSLHLNLPGLRLRTAVLGDMAQLNAIAMRAKAHWGYPAAQMQAWRTQLEVSAQWVNDAQVGVALIDQLVVGFYAIALESDQWALEHLWVEPSAMKRGVGRALLAMACRSAGGRGAADLTIDADPHAAPFYAACGAQLVGAKPAAIDGQPLRTLPIFRLATSALND